MQEKRKKNVGKENHGETNGQYKRERHGETLRGELLKCREREKKNMQRKRISVKQMGSIIGKDTVKHYGKEKNGETLRGDLLKCRERE